MSLKIIQLTDEQLAELEDMQAEIMRMFVADPDRPGAIRAQVFPSVGEMRVRVAGPDMVAKLKKITPAEWAKEERDGKLARSSTV